MANTEKQNEIKQAFAGGDFSKVMGKAQELVRAIVGEHDNIGIGLEYLGLNLMAQCFMLDGGNNAEVLYIIDHIGKKLGEFQQTFLSRRFLIIAYKGGKIVGWDGQDSLESCSASIENIWLNDGFHDDMTFDVLDTKTNHVFGDYEVKEAVRKPYYFVHNMRKPMGKWETVETANLNCIGEGETLMLAKCLNFKKDNNDEYRVADFRPYTIGCKAKVVRGVCFTLRDDTEHEFLLCKKLIHETE